MSAPATREERIALFAAVAWLGAAAIARRAGVWAGIGTASVLLGALTLAGDRDVRRRLAPTAWLTALGVAAAGALVAVTYLLSPLLALAPWLGGQLPALYAAFRAAGPHLAALALVPVVVGEELVWRGAVQGALERRVGREPAAALSAAFYALAHAPIGSPLLVLAAFGCGLVWSALRAASGSLVPSLVSHALWDAVVLLVRPLVPA